MLVDFFDGDLRKAARGAAVVFERLATLQPCRHAAKRENAANTARCVGAAAEAEQEDAVAGPPKPDNGLITIDNIGGQAEAGRLTQEVMGHADIRLQLVLGEAVVELDDIHVIWADAGLLVDGMWNLPKDVVPSTTSPAFDTFFTDPILALLAKKSPPTDLIAKFDKVEKNNTQKFL